jgi:hypothetical protein
MSLKINESPNSMEKRKKIDHPLLKIETIFITAIVKINNLNLKIPCNYTVQQTCF